MQPGEARTALGKRAVYGLVAGTFALTGIAALALQFYARQNSRTTEPPAANAAPTIVQPAVPPVAAPASALQTPPAPVVSPAPAPTTAPALASFRKPPPSPRLRSRAPRSLPRSLIRPGDAGARRPRHVGHRTHRADPDPVGVGSAGLFAPPANEAERQARCIEILQKASLEQITPAETSFFKKECK